VATGQTPHRGGSHNSEPFNAKLSGGGSVMVAEVPTSRHGHVAETEVAKQDRSDASGRESRG